MNRAAQKRSRAALSGVVAPQPQVELPTIRALLNINRSTLEQAANLSRGTIRDIEEHRNSNPTVEVMTKIVDALRNKFHLHGASIELIYLKPSHLQD